MPIRHGWSAGCVAALIATASSVFLAQAERDYKDTLPIAHSAIGYDAGPSADVVATLARQVEQGAVTLTRSGDRGYLPALLDQLHVAADSQLLVFSKTSFQADRISPGHPRAIYFNDEVAIGYVPGAVGLEVAAIDPTRGPVFYAVAPGASGQPSFTRSNACLKCHHGPNTLGVPGLYVGSVIPGPSGAPRRDDSAIITDHRTPFAQRWGGWYVTARRGEPLDRANAVASNPSEPDTLVRDARQNLPHLHGRVTPASYPVPSSDIVALMTFEHQTQMTNLLTRVGWEARLLTQTERPASVTPRVLDATIEEVVHYMLYGGEVTLTEPIEGVSPFATTFAARGPSDGRGRSLRQFDLQQRLFRYPLSYMIYSEAFERLPDPLRERIYRRLFDVLTTPAPGPSYAHLSRADRRAVLDIVRETKRNLPAFFRAAP